MMMGPQPLPQTARLDEITRVMALCGVLRARSTGGAETE